MSQTLGRAINFLLFAATSPLAAQQPGTRQLKDEVLQEVVSLQKLSQEITDMAFSFGELGFREHSTVKLPHGRAPAGRLPHHHRLRRHAHVVSARASTATAKSRFFSVNSQQ